MSEPYQLSRVPAFESLTRSDESFRVIEIDSRYSGCSWHFHPELQLCHVISGAGQRAIGDQICPIVEGEVILLGANLPHVWRYDSAQSDEVRAIVLHFDESSLGNDFLGKHELRDIRLLLARAGQGLLVHGATRIEVAERLSALTRKSGFDRVLGLLEILHCLSVSKELRTICGSGFQPVAAQLDLERLRRACDYIRENACGNIDRDSVASIVHMSPSGFSRFFKSHTGMTFQDFVSDVRIGAACRLLVDRQLSVTQVAFECGFADVSTFNRAFKKFRDTTPSAYRRQISQLCR